MRALKSTVMIFTCLLVVLLMITPASAITKTLRERMTSSDVMALQKNLLVLGHFPVKAKTTYYFGTVTKASVLKYQKANALKADGLVTPRLFQRINDGAKKISLSSKAPSSETASDTTTGTALSSIALDVVPVTTPPGIGGKDGTASELLPAADPLAMSVPVDAAAQDAASISRGGERNFLSHWFEEGQYLFPTGMDALAYDIGTGQSFRLNHSMTSANHADSETKSAEDTRIMLAIWNGTFKSTPRPVILIVNGRAFAASVAGKPHCGLDALPFLAKLVNGDAYGDYVGRENCDKIKGNEMNGHFDVHFYKSRNHYNNLEDPAHQNNVLAADAWAKANLVEGLIPGYSFK